MGLDIHIPIVPKTIEEWFLEEQRQRQLLTRKMWEAYWGAKATGVLPPPIFSMRAPAPVTAGQ